MNLLWFTWKDRSHPTAGGAEVVNEELASRLALDGHRVTFIVAGFRGCKPVSTRQGFRIIRAGSRFTAYYAAWRYYKQHEYNLAPDLVIDECNTMPFFVGWYTHAPTVLFFHMLCRRIWFYEFPPVLSAIGYIAEPLYLRLLKHTPVIAVSNSTKQDLVRHSFKANTIKIISEGIEYKPIQDLKSVTKYKVPTLLSLGSVRSMKRTLHQIKAFEIAKTQIPSLRIIIAGDTTGRYGNKIMKYVDRSKFERDIIIYGRVTSAKKLELMQKSHLILSTSVKEGWGLTITEAASQGTPAVVYDADGLRDSVQNGRTGLVTAASPKALAGAVVNLLTNPKKYETARRQAWLASKKINFNNSYADLKRALSLR